ncbi:TetR/AcrR family transcriptional regulator [Bowmanella yangjiangensis]|uniref:TetR family transcriptional regulator n=1 Tax=Bowmanella yangjiangensis TaxID=2811230 RepID=A0ABS3D1D7_9ALTE|nr:TetR family transcriptional regulator [Bowmanella yangjiangensis]MBN7821724.1 TetR family transcriptional regulator [Bowmanella yangjiangensis]
MTGTVDKKTVKSEITRGKILEAALDLIAEGGLAALSHRTIASRAEVRLSLTSYYFGSLDNLIEAAFDRFVEQTQPYRDKVRANIDQQCQLPDGSLSAAQLDGLTSQLADFLTQHIQAGVTQRRRELGVESHFVYAFNVAEPLAAKIQAFTQMQLKMIESVCLRFGSSMPWQDAHLILAAISQMEFAHANGGREFDAEFVYQCLKRLFSSLFTAQS